MTRDQTFRSFFVTKSADRFQNLTENIPIVVGTIPMLACIPVLSGKKSTRRRARLRFSHSDTN